MKSKDVCAHVAVPRLTPYSISYKYSRASPPGAAYQTGGRVNSMAHIRRRSPDLGVSDMGY